MESLKKYIKSELEYLWEIEGLIGGSFEDYNRGKRQAYEDMLEEIEKLEKKEK